MAIVYLQCGNGIGQFTVHSNSSSQYPQTCTNRSFGGYTGFASSYTDCYLDTFYDRNGNRLTSGVYAREYFYQSGTWGTAWDLFSDKYVSTITSGRYIEVFVIPTCSYYANGGTWSGVISDPYKQQLDSAGYYYTSTPSNNVSRSGYTLLGWSASSSATTPTYSTNEAIGVTSVSMTLYAVWRSNSVTITLNGNGGKWASGTAEETSIIQVQKTIGDYLNFGNYKSGLTRAYYTHKGWYANGSTPAATYGVDESVQVGGTDATYMAYWEFSKFYYGGVSDENDATIIYTGANKHNTTAEMWNNFQDYIYNFAQVTETSNVSRHYVTQNARMMASDYNDTLAEIKKIKTKIGSSRTAPSTVVSGVTVMMASQMTGVNSIKAFFNGLIDDYY